MLLCVESLISALMERIKTARPNSAGSCSDTSTTSNPQVATAPPDSRNRNLSRPSRVSVARSQRSSANRVWTQSKQRANFLQHLYQWSLNYDSNPYFNGKICLLPQGSTRGEQFELGKSVRCVLMDTSFPDARRTVVIRLYAPLPISHCQSVEQKLLDRRDSMEPIREGNEASHTQKKSIVEDALGCMPFTPFGDSHNRYKLVIRCGAGWVSAHDYFGRIYFSHLEARKLDCLGSTSLERSLERRSASTGPRPLDEDSIVVRPLFRPFRRLPPELQDLILQSAAGMNRSRNLCTNEYGMPAIKSSPPKHPISIATLFRISKAMNQHLIPHFYHSTDFEFGLTGFTNFLWQSGPVHRSKIRRLTFRFGKLALLHCIRWLAPDSVFALFEPPVPTNPRALQYFWRCQIQDLVKELHLLCLTVDIKYIHPAEITMVLAILRTAFADIARIRIVETDSNGKSAPVGADDYRLRDIGRQRPGENCVGTIIPDISVTTTSSGSACWEEN